MRIAQTLNGSLYYYRLAHVFQCNIAMINETSARSIVQAIRILDRHLSDCFEGLSSKISGRSCI